MARVKHQAGCVPVRVDRSGALSVLLVTSRYTGQWLAPKGGIDRGEKPKKAAARETLEEAGVQGKIIARLGRYDYPRGRGVGRVEIFVLAVERQFDRWEEQYQRKRCWFLLDEALVMGLRAEVHQMMVDLRQRLRDLKKSLNAAFKGKNRAE